MTCVAKYAKNPTGYCFIAGTLVVTFLGLATIDSIQEGDYVLAKDMDTGVVSYQPVIDTFVREVDETYTITIDGVDIETTAEHPFYSVEDDAFIPAKDLESGDTVETADGDTATVEDVTRNNLDEPTLVYNFEVMDAHTYYVGEDGVLVHNECKTNKNAVSGVSDVAETGNAPTFKSKYDIPVNDKGHTKSSLELGKQVHKEYMADVANGVTRRKEFVLPSGKRVDYIDLEKKIVYELKPNNPNQIRKGTKQLAGYLEEVESVFGEGWTSVLDTY